MKKDIEILVIGAGPAGLSAAIEAAKCGAEVLVVDENNKPGGQLFKQIHKFFGSRRHKAGTRGVDIGTQLLEEVEKLGVTVMLNTVAYGFLSKWRRGCSCCKRRRRNDRSSKESHYGDRSK